MRRLFWLPCVLLILNTVAASAALQVLDASFRPDRRLPEWDIFWKNTWRWGDDTIPVVEGGALTIHLYNPDGSAATINDVTLNGTGLTNGIRCDTSITECDTLHPCSCYYGSGGRPALINAGDTIWWRTWPNPIPAGGTGEVYIRMRQRVDGTLAMVVQASSGNVSTNIAVNANPRPRIAGFAMSSDYQTAYLYLRHPANGAIPQSVYVDGVNRTSSCTFAGDAGLDIVAVKCTLGSAFARGSFHTFKVVYADGSVACDGMRTFYDPWKYGVWGSPDLANQTEEKAWFYNLVNHGVNFKKGASMDWLGTAEGKAAMNAVGFGFMNEDPTGSYLWAAYLCDELDANENYERISSVVPAVIGGLAQSEWQDKEKSFWTSYSDHPVVLNLDANYKPYNYYIYGQLPDILSVDPYYVERIHDSYLRTPNLGQLYRKATYVYAVGSTCQAACEPSPLHMILCITRHQGDDYVFRYATPEEERITAYYAVAAGAKQLDYWWLTPGSPTTKMRAGLGSLDEPAMVALWREVGLVGNEFGLAGPVIVNSCPAIMPISTTGKLFVKSLVSGIDTIVLVCVNEDYACTDSGTMMRAIPNADVSFNLPSWLSSPTNVFEVSYKGVSDVPNSVTGGRITVNLGRVDVSRLIIITKNSSLMSTLQTSYTNTYGPRVATLIPTP